ncbi:FAD/NAD(P)-binding domain-containing protein [Multifurca ochricompacta]|uniref:FAD/NAD(P)-binding domain-containing protein n=1 Tax=Multifurca ochricompacta TaxID=376703 RepID=A0AAD4M2K3_9AGAM|nr:FAD/NAD(P)-binding domain-containing protein [Multifurca ochricompacta]
MSTTFDIKDAALPTLGRLGVSAPSEVDAGAVAQTWFDAFADYVQSGDAAGVIRQLVEDAFWRDILALTWDFRTFYGNKRILQFLSDRLAITKLSALQLDAKTVVLGRPYPDIVWIQASFTFSTGIGTGSGVLRLVPTPRDGEWRAHSIFTTLEGLHGVSELTGPLREQESKHGTWPEQRRQERECEGPDQQPVVLIVGGGQSGLELAARLKYLGIKTLVVEREARIGHLWRKRYEALCLHDTVWYDHMPYLPFPSTWPVFAPAPKLADWLENYAHSLELDVWTSSTVTRASQDPETKKWTVEIERANAGTRTFVVNHLVFAVGIGGGTHNMPKFPGVEEYKGKIAHSGDYTKAKDYEGKKVVVIGACTSGHDISKDLYDHGVDVTMFQRSSTYIMSVKHGVTGVFGGLYYEGGPSPDVADRINASFPNYLQKPIHQRLVQSIAEKDRETLDGLDRVGFRLNTGIDGSGFILLAWGKAGGYYFDVGASQLIIDGKIKLKNDSQIARFTQTGLEFMDGSTLDADAVVFATGYGDARDPIRKILGPEAGARLKPIWGLDSEGEIRGAWRDLGIPRAWCMMGNFALCRFHSKHLALQIKAIEEGLFDEKRYSLE